MSRTINRMPIEVKYPSNKNVQSRYFNHYQWKGINDDKNFLEVDQFAFQKAENVYVDSEGLLRSRPAIKKSTINLFNRSVEEPIQLGVVQNVINFWKFGDITVYYCHDITVNLIDYDYVILFTQADSDLENYNGVRLLAISEDLSTLSQDFDDDNFNDVKIIMAKGKIFVFTYFSISYYDIDTWTYYNSDNASYVSPIYVPTTKVITSTTTTDLESPNVLTNKQIYKYIYTSATGVNIDIYGKEVSFKIGDEEYTVTFTETTRNVMAQLLFNVDAANSDVYPNVAVSANGVIAMFNKTTRYLSLTYDNGKTFEYHLLDIAAGEVYGNVKFSSAGDIVYLCTATGVWVLSVYATNSSGIKKYNELHNFTSDYSVPASFFTNGEWYILVDMIQDGELAMCYTNSSGHCYAYFIDESESTSMKYFDISGIDSTSITHWVQNCKFYNNVSCTYVYNGTTVSTNRLFVVNTNDYTLLIRVNWANINQSCIQMLSLTSNNTPVGGSGFGTAQVFGNVVRIAKDHNTLNTTYFAAYTIASVSLSSNVVTTNVPVTKTKTGLRAYFRKYFIGYDTIVCEQGIYNIANDSIQNYINVSNAYIIAVTPGIYYTNSSIFGNIVQYTQFALYSTNVTDPIEMQYTAITEYDENDQPVLYNYIVPYCYTELNNFYFAYNDIIMISSDRFDSDRNWCWYFPENQQQRLNYYINALHPINDNTVAAFMENEVWYVTYNSEAGAYAYHKSKLQLGIPDGNNVITSLDGTTILFVTKRGLVGLGYQDFVASTEQALSYLSDTIFQIFNDWNTEPIRLHLHGFWLICYKQSTDDCYIYDIRNKSWWHCNYPDHNATAFVTDGTELLCLSNESIFDFDRSDDNYFDDDGTKSIINWCIASQKLYLDAINYYKHIENITFNIALDSLPNSVNDGEIDVKHPTMNIQVCNYRTVRNIVSTENFEYQVDMIRTFVKRLNYFKVCEFQYELSCDKDSYIQYPLSLADVTVRYKIGGQVR